MPPTRLRRARFGVAVTFILHSAIFATWAPRIPTIKENLDLSHDDLGLALGAMAIGLLVGTRLTGRMERYGRTRRPIRLLMPVQGLALVGVGYAVNLATLAGALFVLGVIGGVIDVAMNAHAVAVERLYERPVMSSFHGLWSLGSVAGSAVAAWVAHRGVPVGPHFIGVAVVCIAVSTPLLGMMLPAREEAATRSEHHHEEGGRRPVAPVTAMVLLALMVFASFVVEGSASDWSAVFLHEIRGAQVGFAALGLTVFSCGMTVSRLLGDRIGARIGPVRQVRIGAFLAFAGLVAVLVVDSAEIDLAGYAVVGAGIGPVAPVAFSAAGNTRTARRSSVLGFAVSAGYVGAVLGPVMIGALADRVGLVGALVLPVVLAAVVVAAAGWVGSATGSGPSDGEPVPLDHP